MVLRFKTIAKTICLAILLVLSPIVTTNGADLSKSRPEKVGFSSERLERIAPVLQKYIDNENAPGIITAVARRGKIVHFECFGEKDMDKDAPMTPDTIFRIYSMSKPITSVAVLILFEEGHFFLDDPVEKYIPELKDIQVFEKETEDGLQLVKPKHKMTIRHLLTHTSGLIYGWGDTPVDKVYKELKIFDELLGTHNNLHAFIKKIVKTPLLFHPGDQWHYGVSTDVLGYLVEKVSGMPFEDFLKQRIFEPLGMDDTGFSVPPENADRLAALYQPKEDGAGLEIAKDLLAMSNNPLEFGWSGGGGLVSTTSDYLRFAQMLLNKGELNGKRILGSKTVELMASNHLSDKIMENRNDGFGLGVSVKLDSANRRGYKSAGTFGWGGAAATNFWIDPEEELVCVLMTQVLNNKSPFNSHFQVLTYQAIID